MSSGTMRLVQKTQRLVANGESKEVYRYECPSCQEVFESSSQAGVIACPGCDAQRTLAKENAPDESTKRG